jgi:hypothetical protein
MRKGHNERGIPSESTRCGLSIVPVNGLRTDRSGLSCKVVQCSACLQQTEYTDGHNNCEICGAGLSSGESAYSGFEPTLMHSAHDAYQITPTIRAVNERHYPRISCRNVKAGIKTAQGSIIIVDLLNISRGGLCFTSLSDFLSRTLVSIATHYIEGGHNIFQDGTIIRVQRRGSATILGEYAVEYLF